MQDIKEKKPNQVSKQDYNLYALISGVLITLLLFTVAILSLTGEKRDYSENENRYLAGKPSISISGIKDGKFMKDTESYLSDQFFMRDKLVRTRTNIDIFLGKREINKIYVGRRHFLFEKPAVYDEERIAKTTANMNQVAKHNPKIRHYAAIAPNATEIISRYLPPFAPTQNQTQQIEQVYAKLEGMTTVDLCAALKSAEKPQKLYYKTDHHWTTQAAGIAFEEIAGAMKLNTKPYKINYLPVTNSFQGTLASSSGIFNANDTVYIPVTEPEVNYTVNFVEENRTRTTVFDSSKLYEKSKYDVFFGGNFAEVKMESAAQSDRVLMVIKDSYANCLVPMLIPYFKTIVMVDLRYYNDSLQQEMEKEGVTDILWLYNADTFLNDSSINAKLS
jgi:hypothetical protein